MLKEMPLFRVLLLVSQLLPATLLAQSSGTISGTVTLQGTTDPLHHVSVLVVGLKRTVQTRGDGSFRVENVPPGRYEVYAHMHALADQRKTIEVVAGADTKVDFTLRFQTVRDQVTVTASGGEETTLETFLSSTSLDTTDLINKAATSLGEVLENEAGVAKRSFGPGNSRPVIRGFDGDRVLILQDGVRTGTLSSQSGDHGEPVDANSVERVEVVRGPSTLLYEGNAIGGVVNVVTGHHQVHKEAHDGVRGFVTGLAGNNNNRRGLSGGFEYGVKQWMLFGGGGSLYADDYKTPLGTIENSRTHANNANLGIGRYTDKLFFNFGYNWQDGQYGIPVQPEAEEDHDDHEGEEHEEEGHGHHGPVSIPFRRHNLRLNAGVRNLDNSFLDNFQLTLNYSDWLHREKEGDEVANEFFNKTFVYRGLFEQKQKGRLGGSFGFWGMTRDYKAIGEEAITPPVTQNAFAVYAVEGMNFERFRLQFGGRVEHNRYNPDDLNSRSFTGASGSIGLNAGLWKGGTFVTNFTSSFRAPALEELYANGPHAGNLTYEVGDAALRRERGNGIDLSLRHSTNRIRAEANFFNYWLSSYVFLAPNGEEEDGFPVGLYSQGDSRYRGFEGRLAAGLHPNVWLHLGVDTVNAQLTSGNMPLPRIPPVRGRVGTEFRWRSLVVTPEVVVADRQDRLYFNETETAGYAVVNLKALYSVTTKHTLHLFGFNLFNASDRLYRNHLSFIKSFAPEMGRGVLFTYTLRYF